MPNNINVLLIGSGAMSIEYFNVLKFLKINTTVVGRGEKSANRFKEKTSKDVFIGGFEKYSTKYSVNFTHAIISVGVEKLFDVTCKVIEYGVKNILIEKPGCLSMNEFVSLKKIIGKEKNLNVFIAYNRRFFSSIIESKKLIKKDGGVKSFNFEFTEWSHTIEPLEKAKGVKELWLIGNSTHVIDLAFYLGGKPSEISTYSTGGLSWHPSSSIFSGSGISDKGALFSYKANWESAGRWSLEILTKKNKYLFEPLEKIKVQNKGSVLLNEIKINDQLDVDFKPGLYLQTDSFLKGLFDELCSFEEQFNMLETYKRIANY